MTPDRAAEQEAREIVMAIMGSWIAAYPYLKDAVADVVSDVAAALQRREEHAQLVETYETNPSNAEREIARLREALEELRPFVKKWPAYLHTRDKRPGLWKAIEIIDEAFATPPAPEEKT